MTTTAEAWQAGIDAVVADNGLNKGGAADAIRTVITSSFSNAEATGWIDAVAAEFERLGIINNPTYANLRSNVLADPVAHRALFDALEAGLAILPETVVAENAARLVDLREDRDNYDAAIDRLDVLITAEPGGSVGRLVKQHLRDGKDLFRQQKQQARELIRALTGDPDS